MMTREEVIDVIIRLVQENADVDEVKEESSFMDDLGMASIEVFTFVGELEDELDIRISQKILSTVATVGELADEILRLL